MRPSILFALLSCAAIGCGSPASTCQNSPCPSGGMVQTCANADGTVTYNFNGTSCTCNQATDGCTSCAMKVATYCAGGDTGGGGVGGSGGSGGSGGAGGSGGSGGAGGSGGGGGTTLQPGLYHIVSVETFVDDCQKSILDGDTISVGVTGNQLTLGDYCGPTTVNPTCDRTGYLEGSGSLDNGVTEFAGTISLSDGCSWTTLTGAVVTVTGNNEATVDLTYNESNIDTVHCTNGEGAVAGASSCQSHFTLKISR